MLLAKVQSLLNDTHMKYVSAFKLDSLLRPKAIASAKRKVQSDEIIEKIEFEMHFEKEATARWMNYEVMKDFEDVEQLISYTTVCDLLLIENVNAFEQYDRQELQDLIQRVHCPIAILPERVDHDSIIIVNDSSLDIVSLTKSFLNLFKPELRKLPVSVFVDTPENDSHIHNEKAFIDYLKLYFKNIGIQLMDCDEASCVEEYLSKESLKPIILMNTKSMKSFSQKSFFKSGPIENLITFVIKSDEK
jgi:hypothetical protein